MAAELLFSSVSLVLVWRQRAVLRAKQADPACHAPKTPASQVDRCERAECIRIACDVRDKFAACKHSMYRVGAALSAGEGIRVIRTGVNVESDSYGLCVCGERIALFKALSEGDKIFRFMAMATRDGGISCGACRQLLAEYCPPDMPVVFVAQGGDVITETTVELMLPNPFVLEPLDAAGL